MQLNNLFRTTPIPHVTICKGAYSGAPSVLQIIGGCALTLRKISVAVLVKVGASPII